MAMQKSSGSKATLDNPNSGLKLKLKILLFEKDHIHFFYSPALDLAGYGNSQLEAKDSFFVTLNEFLKYTENKKTLYKELIRLGWTVNEKKKRVHAPADRELLIDNETYRDLKDDPKVFQSSTNLSFALA